MTPSRSYAGIGSRQTPPEILGLMTEVARRFQAEGRVLHSGGATGADTAFFRGATDPALLRIFIPWDGFEGLRHDPAGGIFRWELCPGRDAAAATVRRFHPAPDRLSRGAFALMARNAMQVLGADMATPVGLVVAYAPLGPDGRPTGGTAQAIRIAEAHGISVRNLAKAETLDRLRRWLAS